MVDKDITSDWKKLMAAGQEDTLKEKFISLVPSGLPGHELYEETVRTFYGEELGEVLGEIILTVYGDCSRDDFHKWNYEHLSYIIEASNKYDFSITDHLLNGLPQQLFLMVKKEHLTDSHCD